MHQIQTAGEQKYYDFISDRVKQVRTGMIVWASLLSLALISLFNNIVIAFLLALSGAALAVVNVKSQRELKEKLAHISDKEDFFRQLEAPDVLMVQDGHMLVTKDYVLIDRTDITIYYIPDMEKVEVGLKGHTKKSLLLTDRQGVRHEIMTCAQNSGASKEFDAVYRMLLRQCRLTREFKDKKMLLTDNIMRNGRYGVIIIRGILR